MTALYRVVVAFLALKLTNLVLNLIQFPVLTPAATHHDDVARVSLLVPVRDEAGRLARTLPGLLGQDVHEILFLDDCSTDGSDRILRHETRFHPSARVLTGLPRPAGWTGKTWALSQLADPAVGDLLVFCDADVELAPGAIHAVVQEMRRQGAAAFSVFPRQRTGSFGEHLLVPLIDDVLLCFLPFPLLRASVPSAATANGSIFAFHRDSLDDLGGFGSVRTHVVEDVAMARRVRNHGLRLGLALGGDLVATRMYDRWSGVVTGFGRGLRPAVGGSRAVLLVGLTWHLTVYTLPTVRVLQGARRWCLPVVLAILERLLVEAKTGRRSWTQSMLMPLSPVAAVPVVGRALRRQQTWKGRTYS